jgi:hypothetical protein
MAARYSARMTAKRRFYFAQQVFSAGANRNCVTSIFCDFLRDCARAKRAIIATHVTIALRFCFKSQVFAKRAIVTKRAMIVTSHRDKVSAANTVSSRRDEMHVAKGSRAGHDNAGAESTHRARNDLLRALSSRRLQHLPQRVVVGGVYLRIEQRPAQRPDQQTRHGGDR